MLNKTSKSVLFLFLVSVCIAAAQTPAAAPDWKAVEQALGRPGQVQGDGAYKFGLPRGDLKVSVDGVPVKAPLAWGHGSPSAAPEQMPC